MKPRMVMLALLLLLLTCPGGVLADSWSGHYEVDVTVSTLGVNSYNFAYAVTNLDQGTGAPVGLDGFYVQVPLTATITNYTDPTGYTGGSWPHYLPGGNPGSGSSATLQPGYQWLEWWGLDPASVYPIGTTATFSFDAGNVVLGQHQGAAVTYWNGPYGYNQTYYTGYEDLIQGPAAIPLPGTLALLGPGLVGLAVFGRRRIFKK
jgi:hypothetical protein